MIKSLLFKTTDDLGATIARLFAGFVLLPHALQKTVGAFGGFGFSATMSYFTETVGLPWIVAFMVITIEMVGSISLLLGLATRFWAALLVVLMIGIIFTAHIQVGFFMNWFGAQQGEGYEFHLLMIGLALVALIKGGGQWSADRLIVKE